MLDKAKVLEWIASRRSGTNKLMSEYYILDEMRDAIESGTFDAPDDHDFIAESRTALPYYINQYEVALAESDKWRKEAFQQHPTPEAYDAACKALEKHRKRADDAEARIAELERELEFRKPPETINMQEHDKALENLFTDLYGASYD